MEKMNEQESAWNRVIARLQRLMEHAPDTAEEPVQRGEHDASDRRRTEKTPITHEDVMAALRKWQELWTAPVQQDKAAQWARLFCRALNTSSRARLIRRYWDEATDEVMSRSRFFPYPADVIEAAKAVADENKT